MDHLSWEPHAAGIVIAVRALPGARKNAIRGLQNGALKVAVTQIAEDGKANQALRDFLAEAFNLRRSQIELVSGPTNSQKKFLLRDVTLSELAIQLQAYDVVLEDRVE